MTQVNYSPKKYDIFLGLDVDKNSFAFTVKDHNIMQTKKKIPSRAEDFYNYITNNFKGKKVLCAYEAGPTGFHLYDYLKNKNISCIVVPPTSIKKAPNERVKTNRIDADKLAEDLKAGQLKSIRVPEGAYRELRHLVKTRQDYAHCRKSAKQRIGALLLATNLWRDLKDPEIKWSQKYIKELKELKCTSAVRTRLDMLLNDLDYARKQLLSIQRILKNFCKNNEVINKHIRFLTSIPGIGFIVSVTLLGESGDPMNLKNVRELSAFIGIVPRENSTGENINKGSITHLGSHKLRFLLVEAAWVAIRKDKQLKQFYGRIKARHHPKVAARKAIVAVARKLTQIIYKVLKEQRNYIAY